MQNFCLGCYINPWMNNHSELKMRCYNLLKQPKLCYCISFLDCWSFFRLRVFSSSASLYSESFNLNRQSEESSEGSPEVDFVISRIRPQSNPDELRKLLSLEKEFQGLHLSDYLVRKLLLRFKNDWKSALGVFKWASSRSDYEHSLETCDMMVDILGKMKQMDQMLSLLDEMRKNHLVTLKTIAKAMRRFSGAGQWKDAVNLFDELPTYGLKKNTEAMNLLLDTLCKEGNVIHARAFFLELKKHIAPDARTFNILIHGWCKINRIEEAEWTLQEMNGYGCNPCVITYATLIHKYCITNKLSTAMELLDQLESKGCIAGTVTYTSIMSSMAKNGELDQAMAMAERMKKRGCKPDTLYYNVLIHALGRSGKTNEAVHILNKKMRDDNIFPNASTYNTIISMFCNHGDMGSALRTLQEMERDNRCEPDNLTYYPLLKMCFRAGKAESLLPKLIEDMVNKHDLSLDRSAYLLLINGFARANNCLIAYNFFEEMVDKDISPNHHTCHVLLEAVRSKNMHAAADKIEFVLKNL